MTTALTPQTRLTVVKHLAAGRSLDFAVTATKLSAEQVRQIAQAHGYPDRQKLSWAVDVLTEKIDDAQRQTITPRPDLEPSAQRPAARPTPSPSFRINGRAERQPVPPSEPDSTVTLLTRARASESKRIQALGRKISDQLDDLHERLDAEDRRQREKAEQARRREEERRKAAEERNRAAAEVKAAEEALRKARAKLRGSTATPADAHSARAVRAWAADNGVECPSRGRVPSRVIEAYKAAQAGKERAS